MTAVSNEIRQFAEEDFSKEIETGRKIAVFKEFRRLHIDNPTGVASFSSTQLLDHLCSTLVKQGKLTQDQYDQASIANPAFAAKLDLVKTI